MIALLSRVTIGSGLVMNYAFYGCQELCEIDISASVDELGGAASVAALLCHVMLYKHISDKTNVNLRNLADLSRS